MLKKWVAGFRAIAAKDEAKLIEQLVSVVNDRARAAAPLIKGKFDESEIRTRVTTGIEKLRIIEPSVKLVFKEISWESTRDTEFAVALRKAFPSKDLTEWFEEFTAARER